MQRDLVLRAQTGDHDAYNALALAAVDRLHRTARLILRDQERASDAVQDALIAAWRDIRAVRDPDRFDAWLHRLLVNACFRAANRERRRSVVEVHVAEIDAPMLRSDHDELLVRDELERAFRRLTTEQRAVLVLHHYLDLPDAAAAETLGVPVGTFKSRLHRATAALRSALEADARIPGRATESIA